MLKSGVALCNLVRAIQPDIIKAPSKLAAPFKQMENIGNYLSACTKLGVPAPDSFQTVDLFEGKNMVQVINQIHRLGSVAASRGFQGPTLGVKQATANAREFTEEQMRAGLNTQTFIGTGSHGTAGSQMKTTELLGSNIAKMSMVDQGGSEVKPSATPTFLGGAVDISDTVKAHTASIPTPQIAEPVSVAPPPIPPANPTYTSNSKRDFNATGSYAQAQAAGDMPSSGKGHYISAEERDRRAAEQGGKLLYGMDKELAEKQAAKWDPKLEAEARAWIEAVTGMEIGENLHEGLKSGVILVTLVNTIQPGTSKSSNIA